MSIYAPLDVAVITPRLELRGASDDLLAHLAPLVHSGKASDSPPPYDDPFWAYEQDPDVRVQKWLRGVWRARGTTGPGRWRLPLVVVLDDEPVGMQDLIGNQFDSFGTVESFSWLSSDVRRRGSGTEMRAAVLHLAFAGFDAREAHSEANVDNAGSNGVSQRLGYERNGTSWAECDGRPSLGQRWRLLRSTWQERRRQDITMIGVEQCRAALGLQERRASPATGADRVRGALAHHSARSAPRPALGASAGRRVQRVWCRKDETPAVWPAREGYQGRFRGLRY